MIKKYQDKKWLEKKYIGERLNGYQIAKICGVHHATIYNYLKRFNIPCRSNSESKHLAKGNHCKLSQEAIKWINGELLGDGSLQSRSPYSAKFTYGSKYIEYI